jgi:hypothetical protein
MQTSRIRLAAISAATLALIIATTASVAARPGDRGGPFGDCDQGAMGDCGMSIGDGFGPGAMGEPAWGRMGGLGQRGDLRGQVWDMFGGAIDGFVRHEVTYQTEDALLVRRTDQGTVASTGDAVVEYTLATGEAASVSTDEDTHVLTFTTETVEVGRSGFARERMVPQTVTLADIAAGSEVVVWAQSQEDGTFLAERIIVRPAADVAADGSAAIEADAEAEPEVIDDAAASAPPADA